MRHFKKFEDIYAYNNYTLSDNYILPNISLLSDKSIYYKVKLYDSKIEYLKNTGTQFIDTNIIIDNISTLRVCASFEISNNERRIILGNYSNSGNSVSIEIYKNRYLRIYTNSGKNEISYVNDIQMPINTLINIDLTINFNTCKCNSQLIFNNETHIFENDIMSNLYNNINTLRIFIDYRSKPSTISYPLTLYYLKIYIDNNKVRDFIPVRKNEIGYMYDKVSKQLFDNSGTGDFILGQDI